MVEIRKNIIKKILFNNTIQERKTLSKFATKSYKAIRREKEQALKRDIRPAFFHDTDRILHSKAFSRYIDKTQIFYLMENDHITHRILHVQFVAKIGRTIARFLRLNEDLIEAIALGHDIGHPPFGHEGEEYLSNICKKHRLPGFVHSVESARFLDRIERRMRNLKLNLTLQVLDGILCHDGEIHEELLKPKRNKTWKEFDREFREKEKDPRIPLVPMTLEGCVVRFADVISYIGRDIEDAITLKVIDKRKGEDIPTTCKKILGENNRKIIDTLVKDLVNNSWNNDKIAYSKKVSKALKQLREFNLEKIYSNPKIKTESEKISEMYKFLFDKFLEDLKTKNTSSLIFKDFKKDAHPDYWNSASDEEKVRDFIAGMTDDYFYNAFNDIYFPKRFGRDINTPLYSFRPNPPSSPASPIRRMEVKGK